MLKPREMSNPKLKNHIYSASLNYLKLNPIICRTAHLLQLTFGKHFHNYRQQRIQKWPTEKELP